LACFWRDGEICKAKLASPPTDAADNIDDMYECLDKTSTPSESYMCADETVVCYDKLESGKMQCWPSTHATAAGGACVGQVRLCPFSRSFASQAFIHESLIITSINLKHNISFRFDSFRFVSFSYQGECVVGLICTVMSQYRFFFSFIFCLTLVPCDTTLALFFRLLSRSCPVFLNSLIPLGRVRRWTVL
jgi:hypothetical protein